MLAHRGFCDSLRRDHQAQPIKTATGLPIAPLFSGSKMRWLLESVPNGFALAEQGEICLGTIDSWLLWHLTAGEAFTAITPTPRARSC